MKNIYTATLNETVIFAAEELKKYFKMMMPEGGNPTIHLHDGKDGFRLGLMSDFGLNVSDGEDIALDDILYIDCDTDGGIIAGSNPRSVLLATYEYLRQNGCRWLYPGIDGEYIPVRELSPVKYRHKPSMRYRAICDEGASSQECMMESIDFYPKIGLNMMSLEFFNPTGYYSDYYNHVCNTSNRPPEPISDEQVLSWRRQCESELEKRGMLLHNVGHGWTVKPFGMQEWGDKEKQRLPEEYRELMAMVDGKRGLINGMPHLTNVCMSNPRARKMMVDCAVDYAKKQTNVTHLAINFADGFNHHCECDECRKKLPSEWMVTLLNEIDNEFTKEHIDTRIAVSVYEDTCWAPVSVKLKNPSRFILEAAVIWRDFTRALDPHVPEEKTPEYVRNKNASVTDLGVHMTFAREWQKNTKIRDLLSFDYHFWRYYYYDIGTASINKVIYNDVRAFRSNGFSGMIEDASQRSYFPNGFGIYVYARSLFDISLGYEEIAEDYFSHIYGKDWREVFRFFERVSDAFDSKYVSGHLSENASQGGRYAPERAERIAGVEKLVEEIRPIIEKNKNSKRRIETVSYKLLNIYLEYCLGLSRAFVLKCRGQDEEATAEFAKFLVSFGRHEAEIERYYDQSIAAMSFDTYSRIFKGACRAESGVNVF